MILIAKHQQSSYDKLISVECNVNTIQIIDFKIVDSVVIYTIELANDGCIIIFLTN